MYQELSKFTNFETPKSTLKEPGFRLIAGNITTKWDEIEKLKTILLVLFPPPNQPNRYPEVREMLTGFYSVPQYFRKYVASLRQFRGLDFQYIRNLIVGWRRRMDPQMDSKLKIESIPEHAQTLVTSIRESRKEKVYSQETRKNMETVLHFLQRNHCVQFLWESEFDVTLFTKESYREGFMELKKLVESDSIPPDRMFFSHKKTDFQHWEIKKAVKREVDLVDKIIEEEEAKKNKNIQKYYGLKHLRKKLN